MVGRTLGHYRLLEKIGAGGMGEVYRAVDEHLNRPVAIKVLSADKVADPERKRRFIQEAKAASALNHPNIITIHDVDVASTDGGVDFIVMEYVAGKTLDRLAGRKGLRLSEVLRYGVQLAEALTAAHAVGIVHRDLKPSNVMVTEKGLVKVLDFGLAKLTEVLPDDQFAAAQTLDSVRTEEGTVLGTVAYMSPEQAEGKKVDGRSDIFSFGSVLYEMATGRRAFQGATKLATLSAILRGEPPPVHELAEGFPPEIERIITRCLRKDPERRFQHMEDLKVALEELKEETESGKLASRTAALVAKRRRRVSLAATAWIALGLIAVALGWLWVRNGNLLRGRLGAEKTAGGRLRMLISSANELYDPDLSADGAMIAYVAEDQGHRDLFVGRVAGGGRVRLTNDEARETHPDFSPDGERILFTRFGSQTALSELCVLPTLGGDVITLVKGAREGAWSPDGRRIAFVLHKSAEGDLLTTAAADGTDIRVVMRSDAAYPFFRHPAWSPDGVQLVVVRSTGGISGELWLVPLAGGSPQRLSDNAPGVYSNQPAFTPDGRGIVHVSNRAGAANLWVQPLKNDPLRRLTTGPGPDESPSIARDGTVAFANARVRTALIIHELGTGKTRELSTHSWLIWAPAFSRDGREVAFSRSEKDGSWQLWIVPVDGGSPRRLTSASTPSIYPRFTPDGAFVIYHTWSPGADRIWRTPVGGGASTALTPARDEDDGYADVSPDGRWLAFARSEKEATRIYVAPTEGGEARRLTASPSTLPRWSPDGRWIAFSPSRRYDDGIFVIGADGTGLRRLSAAGGWPVWWPDGKRVGFLTIGPDGNQQIATVPFGRGPVTLLREPRFSGTNCPFDVSPDARLLVTSNTVQVSAEIWLLEPSQ